MLDIKYHACLRYVQRVMEMKEVEELNADQLIQIRFKIAKVLEPYLTQIESLRFGDFVVDGVTYCVDNLNVVTTKTAPSEDNYNVKRVRGGIMRSGCKLKKKHNKSTYERRDERDVN